MEGLSKKEKGLIDMNNSVEFAGERRLNGNGKNTISIKKEKNKTKKQ